MAWLFFVLAGFSVALAYVLRAYFSGDNLKFRHFIGCLAFNVFFVTYYMRFIERDHLLFFGYYPTLCDDYPAIGWIAIVALLLHCFASPVQWKAKK